MEKDVGTLKKRVDKHEERLDDHDIELARKEERDKAMVTQQKWMIALLSLILSVLVAGNFMH